MTGPACARMAELKGGKAELLPDGGRRGAGYTLLGGVHHAAGEVQPHNALLPRQCMCQQQQLLTWPASHVLQRLGKKNV